MSEQTDVEPRSRLYGLAPRGACGASQESMLSYAQRLSAEHRVSVRRMFLEILFPEAGFPAKASGAINYSSLQCLDGCGAGAERFLTAMARLTGRCDLACTTFLPWRNLINPRVGHTNHRRWCPECVAGQLNDEFKSYSLVWSYAVIDACPLHSLRLRSTCAACDRPQPLISNHSVLGQCAYCMNNLCSDAQREGLDEVSGRELFNAKSVADMIQLGETVGALADARHCRSELTYLAETEFGSTLCDLSRRLGLSNGALAGKGAISMPMFLEVLYRLGMTPTSLLYRRERPSINLDALRTRYTTHTRTTEGQLTALSSEVDKIVASLRHLDNETLTLAAVARRLGISPGTFVHNFPKASQTLSEHNRRVRPAVAERRRTELQVKASSAAERLLSRGMSATRKNVELMLRESGVAWASPERAQMVYDEIQRIASARTSATAALPS